MNYNLALAVGVHLSRSNLRTIILASWKLVELIYFIKQVKSAAWNFSICFSGTEALIPLFLCKCARRVLACALMRVRAQLKHLARAREMHCARGTSNINNQHKSFSDNSCESRDSPLPIKKSQCESTTIERVFHIVLSGKASRQDSLS